MKKVLRRRSDLVGIQAIYHKGELIYKDHQAEIEKEVNHVHRIDKKDVDNDQRI